MTDGIKMLTGGREGGREFRVSTKNTTDKPYYTVQAPSSPNLSRFLFLTTISHSPFHHGTCLLQERGCQPKALAIKLAHPQAHAYAYAHSLFFLPDGTADTASPCALQPEHSFPPFSAIVLLSAVLGNGSMRTFAPWRPVSFRDTALSSATDTVATATARV